MNKTSKIGIVATGISLVGAAVMISGNLSVVTQATETPTNTFQPIPIQETMLNAIDNYTSLAGTYHVMEKPINLDQIVSFSIQEGTKPGSYVQRKDAKTGATQVDVTSDGDTLLINEPMNKRYEKDKMNKPSFVPVLSSRETIDSDGKKHFEYRVDPAGADYAADVTNPQNYAFWISPESVLSQDTLLGRDATVVSGNLDPSIAQKHNATTYKMWVDNATGILLRLEEKTASGEVTNLIEVTDVNVNQGVDTSKFSIQLPVNEQEVKPQVGQK